MILNKKRFRGNVVIENVPTHDPRAALLAVRERDPPS
jgi:hypothetical protein